MDSGTLQQEGVAEAGDALSAEDDSLSVSDSTVSWPASIANEILTMSGIPKGARVLDTSRIDGLYPRFPIVSLLAASDVDQEDVAEPLTDLEDFPFGDPPDDDPFDGNFGERFNPDEWDDYVPGNHLEKTKGCLPL